MSKRRRPRDIMECLNCGDYMPSARANAGICSACELDGVQRMDRRLPWHPIGPCPDCGEYQYSTEPHKHAEPQLRLFSSTALDDDNTVPSGAQAE